MSHFSRTTRRQLCRSFLLAGVGVLARPPSADAHPTPHMADRIVVHKAARKLSLRRGGRLLANFPIALGAHPIGPKREQGDARTPEGRYWIDGFNPESRFYRALHLSYPNDEDIQWARAAGVAPGGDIEIHGLPDGFAHYDPASFPKDWTDGCIAVSNRSLDEIWARVQIDTAVDILP